MSGVKHPCSGMTAKQRETFERIASGEALPPATGKTFEKLLARGVIQRDDDRQLGDRLGKFSIPQYSVPLSVHMQWCNWCGENAPGD